ncbi:hypothetical protein C2E23DRAFT_721377 [Lenzites betulinus]|nr:hypothetical protein C2E23DRAFT_721377 [Lenzites betulinus]
MDMSSPPTISAMMRTCRSLYEDATGPRLLLRDSATLTSSDAVLSFSVFMFTGVPHGTRFAYLRSLTVSHGGFSKAATRALTDILLHGRLALESLTLNDAEDVLGSAAHLNAHPDANTQPYPLLYPFSSLFTLRHLTMSGIGTLGSELLCALRSPLQTASLAFDAPDARWAPDGPEAQNPIIALAHAADTLEELSGSGFNIAPSIVRYAVQYPRVRRLCARYSPALGGAMPATAAYAYAFPALAHLALCAGTAPVLDPFAVRVLAATRSTNRDDQLQYGGWEHLRVVEGTVADVYALGLVRPVPEMRLQGIVRGADFTEGWLETVLDDVRPTTLKLTVVRWALFGRERLLARVFRTPAAQGVRSLDMQFLFAPFVAGASPPERVLEAVFRTVKLLPLRTLALTFNYALLAGSSAPYAALTVCYLKAVNISHYIRRLKDAMPGLEEVTVTLSDHLAEGDRWLGEAVRRSGSPLDGHADGASESGEEEEVMQQLAELGFGVAYDAEAW